MASVASVKQLRKQHYNAVVTSINRVHDELLILRVKPDRTPLEFTPGQYTVLGLGYWEPRIAGTQNEHVTSQKQGKLIKRAYSISCRLIDEQGRLVQATADSEIEFYIALVRLAAEPPALTPRLFQLKVGDRLFLGPRAHGHYTLQPTTADDQIIFAATGTGEAPHNAMIAELLRGGHRGPIACITCVRYRRDLGYLAKHSQLQHRFANYRYIPLTTREPKNLDKTRHDYIGKRYLQDFFESSEFSGQTGISLTPKNTQVFLCGGPEMIGVPSRSHHSCYRYPIPKGMVEVLEQRGFHVDRPHEPGNIHFEKFW